MRAVPFDDELLIFFISRVNSKLVASSKDYCYNPLKHWMRATAIWS
jgi:hypothetical protein